MIKLPTLAAAKMAAKSSILWIAIAVLVSTNSCSYLVGKSHQKAKQAEKELVVARKETQAVAAEAEKRTPVVAQKEGAAVAAKGRIDDAKRKLYYDVPERKGNTGCDLTQSEFDAYGVLADEINKAASR